MPLSPIGKGDVDAFDKVIVTNLRGTFLVFAQAAQHISVGGRIIAFSSSVLAKSFPSYGPYIASKAGLEGLVHVLANELRGRNVTVNAVAPGPIATELFLNGKSENQISEFTRCHRWRGWGNRRTLRTSSRSSQVQTADGSTHKCYARTAALPTEARKVQVSLTS